MAAAPDLPGITRPITITITVTSPREGELLGHLRPFHLGTYTAEVEYQVPLRYLPEGMTDDGHLLASVRVDAEALQADLEQRLSSMIPAFARSTP